MNKKKYLKPIAEITGMSPSSSILLGSVNNTGGNGNIDYGGGGTVPGRSPYYHGNWAYNQDWEDDEE